MTLNPGVDPEQYKAWTDEFQGLVTAGLELGLAPGEMRGELEAALENAEETLAMIEKQ